jgi:hypothetical protein
MMPELDPYEYALFKEWYARYGVRDIDEHMISRLIQNQRSRGMLRDGEWNTQKGFYHRGYITSPKHALTNKTIEIITTRKETAMLTKSIPFFTYILINGGAGSEDNNFTETYFGYGMDNGWLTRPSKGFYQMTEKGVEALRHASEKDNDQD